MVASSEVGDRDGGRRRAGPVNLPAPDGELFGRTAEVGRICELLDGGHRLVTVTGPGGVGKTRVAAEVARTWAEQHGAPVTFVALADVEPGATRSAIVRALVGPQLVANDDLAVLDGLLATPATVLVLDTFERVRRDAAVVAELLDRFPSLRIVVTSRARLRLRAETVVALAPLERSAAVELFVARAGATTGTDLGRDAGLIAEICDAVGCLPLALELAALRASLLSPQALLDALRTGGPSTVTALARGSVDDHPRHRDLAGTLDWTYDLLDPAARQLFLALGVMSGPFDVETAIAVCPPEVDAPLDALAELAEVHLVVPDEGEVSREGRRFRLPATVAAYAADRLRRDGDLAAAQRRRADHAQRWVVEAGAGLRTAGALDQQRRITADLVEVEALLRYRHQQGQQDLGLEAAVAVAPYWLEVGPRDEGRRRLSHLLAMGPAAPRSEPDPLRLQAEAWEAHLAAETGDRDALARLEAAVDALWETGLRLDEAVTVTELLVRSLIAAGRLQEAEHRARWCEETCRADHLDDALAPILYRRAFIARQRGHRDDALALAREARHAAARVGDAGFLARSEAFLRHEAAGDLGAIGALDAIEVAVQRNVTTRQRTASVWAMLSAGATAAGADDAAAALMWSRRALDAADEIGHWQAEWCAMVLIAALALDRSLHEAGLGLHGALEPYLDELATGLVPPEHVRAYRVTVERSIGIVGAKRATAMMGACPADWPALIEAARTVADELAQAGQDRAWRRATLVPGQVEPLTDRELEVLAALARGGTNREVAAELHISHKTVMHHAASIYRKLAVRNRAEAVALALRSGALT